MPEVIPQPEITRGVFVGRDVEMAIIDNAISDKRHLRIVNIQGAGGIGKTSILCEVQRRYGEQDGLLVTEIVDFFDIATHSQRGFLDEVVRELSEGGNGIFEEYREARYRVDEIELAGITGSTLEDAQEDVRIALESCYNTLVADKRIVLLIDTFEVVQHVLGEWLAGWLGGLKNTVVIIAGRKNRDWQDELVAGVGHKAVDYIDLKGFEFEDTKKLFALAEAGREIIASENEEELQKLQLLSAGRPILLILAVDREWPMALRAQRCPTRERTETSARYTLDELNAMSTEELEHVRKDFRVELITAVLRLRDMYSGAQAILYMAQVYKYFTPGVLAYLMNSSEKEAKELLTEIKPWTFVKYDERTGSYWLHDLVRDLVMEHAWPEVDPTGDERQSICRRAVECYDTLLAGIVEQEAKQQSVRKQAQLAGNPDHELAASRELVNLKRRRQHYQVQQVYYDIIADYENGIGRYNILFVSNVWAREREIYELVRQERDLALEVLGRTYPDHAKRLEDARIKIVIEREYDEGLAILDSLSKTVRRKENSHLYADILLYQGIAHTYKGESGLAEDKLRGAIEILDELRAELKAPLDSEDLRTRRVSRTLGRAYGNLGYAFATAGHLSEAIGAYQGALRYYKIGKLAVSQATTLNDLGYIYARLGKYAFGKKLCKDGLAMRERLLLDHYIGLSYTTLGGIEYLDDQPNRGKKHFQWALAIFERIGDPRGLGLAHFGLGESLVRIGQLDAAIGTLKEAKEHLTQAKEIFKKDGKAPEPMYLANTYEKTGLLYQDWGEILRDGGAAKSDIDECFNEAEGCFRQCIEVYRQGEATWSQAMAMERLFTLYTLSTNDFVGASQMLQDVEKIGLEEVPNELLLPANERKTSIDKIEFKRREFLYLWGKVERGKGRLAFANYWGSKRESGVGESKSHLKEAAKHYTLACAFLELFSEEAHALEVALEEITSNIRRLSKMEIAEFQKQVKATQHEYDLERYPRILEWVKDISGIM